MPKEEEDTPPKGGLQRSYKTMNLALRNRNESTELKKLLKQLEREERYVQKRINIDIRLIKVRYKRFLPVAKEEQEDTDLIFRSIREPGRKKNACSRNKVNSAEPFKQPDVSTTPNSLPSSELIEKVIKENCKTESKILPSISSVASAIHPRQRASFSKSAPICKR